MLENLLIFIKPKKTIKLILSKNYKYASFILATLVGFGYCLDKASINGGGDLVEFYYLIPICLLAGIPYGILIIYFWSYLLRFFGKFIGGKGTYNEIITAVSWSALPVVIGLLIWIPELYLFGGYELFQSNMETVNNDINLANLYYYFVLIEITLPIIWLVLLVPTLAEVQSYSIFKSIINLLLPILVIGAPLLWLLNYSI